MVDFDKYIRQEPSVYNDNSVVCSHSNKPTQPDEILLLLRNGEVIKPEYDIDYFYENHVDAEVTFDADGNIRTYKATDKPL
ncbi:hypothetical protein PQ478_09445 [Alkalihalophilus pseudofirmus]|uniref:hypothetical protein n=1 Tax=Alkalihalophilus pseudofirmus TaxID=79885 RepID=UPI00259B9615|nr:hypothetical protein [Alkalihalophilus pseudofirmus]WEG18692.1 hypothetical protein PQ478_09445 [Alkalihalophilus pseudofirmus]